MKLLHVITTLDVGGAEMHLLSQVRGQAARGIAVRVAYLKGQGTLAEDFRAAGAEWVGHVGPLPLAPLKLWSLLRWCELVHTHLLKADMLGALCATLAGRRGRLVSGKHNDEQVLRRPAVAFVHGVLGRLPVLTIALSEHVARFVVEVGRLPSKRVAVVHYGIDPTPFEDAAAEGAEARRAMRVELGLGVDDIVFVCVARFAPQKAHDVLLRAFRSARDQQPADAPPLRLLLVGDDPFGDGRTRAEALARELELGDAVRFAGIRRDVPLCLAASDVFVMSSLWEGLGLVFLEAMACDLPVLSTQVSAIPEVVVPGETGLLVSAGEVAPLAAGFLELAGDPALRRRLGQAGHARVLERFGLDRMVEATLAHYRTILEG